MILTASSSVFIYVIISIERFLSIYRPLWHRVSVRSELLWRAVRVAWLLAMAISILRLCLMLSIDANQRKTFSKYYDGVLIRSLIALIAIITVIFVITLIKALKSTNVNKKKQIKLISTSLLMFILFLPTFSEIVAFGMVMEGWQWRSNYTAYTQTSTRIELNPAR